MKKFKKRLIKGLKNPLLILSFIRYKVFNLLTDKLLNDGERFDPNIFKKFWLKDVSSTERYVFAAKFVRTTDEILDIACGTGYGTFFLSQNCRRATGVDIFAPAIEFAVKKYQQNKNISFVNTGLLANSVQADVVVSFETIEHLDEDLKMVVEKLVSFSRRQLIASVPYLEASGHNRHHRKFSLQESDFSFLREQGKLDFFYQDSRGRITPEFMANAQTLLFVFTKNL